MSRASRLLFCLLTCLGAFAAAPLGAEPQQTAFEVSLQEILVTLEPLGVREAVLVIETPSGERFSASVGVPGDRKAQQARLFQIGSQTKWFTAAAVLLLAEEGALRLDDPVLNHLPDLQDADGVTLRQLLTHTSGMGDAVEYLETDGRPPEGHFTFEQLTFLSRVKGSAFEPGADYAYNNFGFDVLGAVVERAAGKSRAEFVRERILTPLGMDDVYFGESGRWPMENAARGFYAAEDGPLEMTGPRDLSWASAAGDMIAGADNLLIWLAALQNPDNPSGLILEDFTKQPADSSAHGDDMPQYGFGVMGRIFAGRRTWGHGGFIHGYVTYSGVDAQNGVRFVLLMSSKGDPGAPQPGLLGGAVTVIGAALHLADFAIKTGALD